MARLRTSKAQQEALAPTHRAVVTRHSHAVREVRGQKAKPGALPHRVLTYMRSLAVTYSGMAIATLPSAQTFHFRFGWDRVVPFACRQAKPEDFFVLRRLSRSLS